jgi:hypothetical protein
LAVEALLDPPQRLLRFPQLQKRDSQVMKRVCVPGVIPQDLLVQRDGGRRPLSHVFAKRLGK